MTADWRSSAWAEATQEPDTLILRLGGVLDSASRDAIEPTVMAAITSAATVIVDLGQLAFCDSHGTAMFIAAREKAEAEGTTLSVLNLRPAVRRIFDIAGLDYVIDLAD